MAIDRADWHYGGEFPKGLPDENGGTHIGMFLAWAIINHLEGSELQEDVADSLERVRARQMTGRDFLFKECDEKFWEADLNDEANAFAKYYYTEELYLKDYALEFAKDGPTMYHVADTWENFDRIAKIITSRFTAWKTRNP